MNIDFSPFVSSGSVKRAAADVQRRMEEEFSSLVALERDLDRLDREICELRAQIVRGAKGGGLS